MTVCGLKEVFEELDNVLLLKKKIPSCNKDLILIEHGVVKVKIRFS